MRGEHLTRLNYVTVSINNPHYLFYKYIFHDLKQIICEYANGDVLDIGCGNKPYLPFFENKIDSYTGCDIVQSNENKVDIICQATDIPLPDNCKDVVFSTQVIEHVADHRKLLSEAYRILKPGGNLILSGPMCWEHHEVPFDFFRFTKYGFEYLLKETGFTPIVIKPNGGKWAMVGQITLNSIRSSINRKTFLSRFMNALYFIFRIKWLINVIFSYLDRVDRDDSATLNFVVVARK